MPLLTIDTTRLRTDGCKLVDPPFMFLAICQMSGNNPCNGCAYLSSKHKGPPDCPAYLKHHSTPQHARRQQEEEKVKRSTDQSGLIGGKWAGLTIKQIAAQEGISLNQARQRKLDGHYKN